jgi:competence protein ComEA
MKDTDMANTEKVDLNAASAGELTQLPGIAKDLAHRIISYRKRHAGFKSWEDLQKVHGFPVSRLAEIKQRGVLGERRILEAPHFPKLPHGS